MNGIRLERLAGEIDFLYRISKTQGAYGTDNGKDWYATTPNGLYANLSLHAVTVHDDGTITVYPSILVEQGKNGPSWHGYLERGVWREC